MTENTPVQSEDAIFDHHQSQVVGDCANEQMNAGIGENFWQVEYVVAPKAFGDPYK